MCVMIEIWEVRIYVVPIPHPLPPREGDGGFVCYAPVYGLLRACVADATALAMTEEEVCGLLLGFFFPWRER